MDDFAELIEANAAFAADFDRGALEAPPRRHLAIVTCMDCRIEPLSALGLVPGDAHILRNAGARITDDVLRSLVKSVLQLGVERIAVVHHTDCGAAKVKLDFLHERVRSATGNDPVEVDFHLIGDPAEALEEDIRTLAGYPYLPAGLPVAGFVYDVTTGRIEPGPRATVG